MRRRGVVSHVVASALAVFLWSTGAAGAAPGGPGAVAAAGALELNDANSWPFAPQQDRFTDSALLDLRSLNEKLAGETGFVRLSEDGSSFVLGDGTPVRFWAVNTDLDMSPEALDEHCRFLAKLGVNMARISFSICDNSEGAPIAAVNEKEIDNAMRFVATAKKYGIYTFITPYRGATGVPRSWGLEGARSAAGLLFFNSKLQDAYKTWMKELYTRPNPYDGGLPLGKEPALAVIQVQDGDGLFWWSVQNLADPQMHLLEKQFGDWLVKKYKSLDAAYAAWDAYGQVEDDFDAGEVALIDGDVNIWAMTQYWTDGAAKRMSDEIEFLANLQHDFYADMEVHCRKTLGCGQLLVACNWETASPLLLEDVERWTYTAGDIIAENRSCGVTGGRVRPGQALANRPVVLDPLSYPGADKQVVGHPFVLTDTTWADPARYQAEGPFLAAAYSSLTGVDIFFWSGAGAYPTWQLGPRMWTSNVPQDMGMWPANALAFRKGYVAQAGEAAVHEERSLADMWDRTVPIISERGEYAPDRSKDEFAHGSPIKQQVDPLAFMVGPVEVRYGGDPSNTRAADLRPYVDRAAGIVRSITGQIVLDYKEGVCTVNAPRCQGAAGFLKAGGGSYSLADVSITSTNEYAAVSVVPMDGEPLARSHEVLVQVGTVVRPTGWRVGPATLKANGQDIAAYRIIATGKPPLRVANTEVTLTIADPDLSKATLLDPSGYAAGDVPVTARGGRLTVALPPQTMYLVLR